MEKEDRIGPDFFKGSRPASKFDEATRKIAQNESRKTFPSHDDIDSVILWEPMDGGGERPRSWTENEVGG